MGIPSRAQSFTASEGCQTGQIGVFGVGVVGGGIRHVGINTVVDLKTLAKGKDQAITSGHGCDEGVAPVLYRWDAVDDGQTHEQKGNKRTPLVCF